MSDSKFKRLQKEVCDPALEPPPLKKFCAPCVPNQSYIEPDWEFIEIAEPYLNEKQCEYQITVTVNKFGDSFTAREFRNLRSSQDPKESFSSREALLQSFVHPAIVLILEEYGKLVADQIICATVPGIPGSALEIISEFDSFEGVFVKLAEQEVDPNRVRCEDIPVANSTLDPSEPFDFQSKIIEMASRGDVQNPFALELYARINDFYIDPIENILKVHIGIPSFIIDQVPELPSREELEEEAMDTRDSVVLIVWSNPKIRVFTSSFWQVSIIFLSNTKRVYEIQRIGQRFLCNKNVFKSQTILFRPQAISVSKRCQYPL